MTDPKAKNIIVELKSTNLRAVEYDPFMKTMVLRFHTGGDYEYINVGRKIFNDLVKAESAGKFFHTHIRGKYEFLKVTKRETPEDFKEAAEALQSESPELMTKENNS